MLAGENFGWGQQGRLRPRFQHGQHGQERDNSLATAHIPLQEPEHLAVGFEVCDNLCNGVFLANGQGKGQETTGAGAQMPVPGGAVTLALASGLTDEGKGQLIGE